MSHAEECPFTCAKCKAPMREEELICPACEYVHAAPEPAPVESGPESTRRKLSELGITPHKKRIEWGPDLDRVVALTVRELAREETIFDRDGYLVTVLRATPEDATRKRAPLAVGSPVIREISAASLKEKIAGLVLYVRKSVDKETGKERTREVPVPSDVVAAVLARGEWASVRPLVGLLEAPSLRPDGSIIDRPGYDDATGYLYLPSAEFPPVPEASTGEHAHTLAALALAELQEVFADFPFAGDTERLRAAHAAVPLALLLTMIARPAIAGCVPATLIDANEAGTGKTLATQAPSVIAYGRRPSLMTWPVEPPELEKILAACAVDGAPHIAFDNLARPFAGEAIDKVLTTDRVKFRVLGKTETPELPWRAVITATGNNLEVAGDTMRRVLVCRVDAQCERPEERGGFAHPDLVAWCLAERPRLVVAALTILRAFVVAGRPAPTPPLKPFGSFEAWSALVPSALVWAGAGNVLLARTEIQAKGDPARLALGTLLAGWKDLDPEGSGISAKEALAQLYTKQERPDGSYQAFITSVEDELSPVRDAVETLCPQRGGNPQPTAHAFGNMLRRSRDRVVGGRVLRGTTDRNGVAVWTVLETSSVATTAGTAGTCGDSSNLRAREFGSDQYRNGLNKSPQVPAVPADGPADGPALSVGRTQ